MPSLGNGGKDLAIRLPLQIARAAGQTDGENLEIEAIDGDILIRRSVAHARTLEQADPAAAEIIADGDGRTLGDVSIRSIREDGRRG